MRSLHCTQALWVIRWRHSNSPMRHANEQVTELARRHILNRMCPWLIELDRRKKTHQNIMCERDIQLWLRDGAHTLQLVTLQHVCFRVFYSKARCVPVWYCLLVSSLSNAVRDCAPLFLFRLPLFAFNSLLLLLLRPFTCAVSHADRPTRYSTRFHSLHRTESRHSCKPNSFNELV